MAMSPAITGMAVSSALVRSCSIIGRDSSMPVTGTPRRARGMATRPVPMANSSARPSPAVRPVGPRSARALPARTCPCPACHIPGLPRDPRCPPGAWHPQDVSARRHRPTGFAGRRKASACGRHIRQALCRPGYRPPTRPRDALPRLTADPGALIHGVADGPVDPGPERPDQIQPAYRVDRITRAVPPRRRASARSAARCP